MAGAPLFAPRPSCSSLRLLQHYSMKRKVSMIFFPRTSKRCSPPTPAYLPVPPLMAFTPGASPERLGYASTPCTLISPPGRVNVFVHSAMCAFSEDSSAGSVIAQNRSKRPILSFPLSS